MAYTQTGDERFADENGGTFVWESVGNVTGWSKSDKIIFAIAVTDAADHSPDADTLTLQWQNVTEASAWTDLASTGEMKWGTTTGYTDGDDIATADKVCNGEANRTYEEGPSEKAEGKASVTADLVNKNYYTEFWFCVDPADAAAGDEYAFRFYDDTNNQLVDTDPTYGHNDYTLTILDPTVTTTLDVDSVFRKGRTLTSDLDSVFLKERTKTLSLDAKLFKILWALDDLVITIGVAGVAEYTKTIDVDAILKIARTKNITVDSILRILRTRTSDLDAILRILRTNVAELDAILRLEKTLGIDVDTI